MKLQDPVRLSKYIFKRFHNSITNTAQGPVNWFKLQAKEMKKKKKKMMPDY